MNAGTNLAEGSSKMSDSKSTSSIAEDGEKLVNARLKAEQEEIEKNYLTGWKLALCLIGINVTNFLGALDTTVAITIQSAVENRFQSYSNIGWLSSGYILPIAVLAMVWGRIAMIIGRRVSIFAAIFIFEAGSLVCGLANSMNMLIGGRILAGIGGAGLQSIVYLIINDVVPLNRRAFATTLMTFGFSVASVVGPIVGGAFANSKSATWRWAFYINLPAGGAALILMAIGYRQKASTEWSRFKNGSWRYRIFTADLPGAMLICVGLTLFLLALSFGGGQFAWNSAAVICCFVLGGIIVIMFLVYEFVIFDRLTAPILKEAEGEMFPLLAYDLVKNFRLMAGMWALLFQCVVFFLGCIAGVTYFEIILGMSPLTASLHVITVSVASTVASIACGVIVTTTGYMKPLIILGGICSPLGSGIMTLLGTHPTGGQEIGLLIPFSVAFGCILIPVLISSQVLLKHEAPQLLNIVTSFFSFMRSVGSCIGSNLATAIFTAVATNGKNKIAALKEYNINDLMDGSVTVTAEEMAQIDKVLVKSYHTVMYVAVAMGGLVFIFSLFTTDMRAERAKKGDDENKDIALDSLADDQVEPESEQMEQAERDGERDGSII